MKGKIILWVFLLLIVFLAGFVPQFMKAYRLSAELDVAREELASCREGAQLSRIRDLAALVYLEVNRKNFGVAGEHSSEFFGLVQELAQQTEETSLRESLAEILASRDTITAGLASADPTVLIKLQALLIKLHEMRRE